MNESTSDYVLILSAHCELFSKYAVQNLYDNLIKYDAASIWQTDTYKKK